MPTGGALALVSGAVADDVNRTRFAANAAGEGGAGILGQRVARASALVANAVRPRRRGVLRRRLVARARRRRGRGERRAARRRAYLAVGVGGDGDNTTLARNAATRDGAPSPSTAARRSCAAARSSNTALDGGALALAGAARADAIGARFAGNSAGANGGVAALAALASPIRRRRDRWPRISAAGTAAGSSWRTRRCASVDVAESDDERGGGGASSAGDEFVANRAGVAGGALFWNWETMGGELRARERCCATTRRAGTAPRSRRALHRRRARQHDREVSGTGAFRRPSS